MVREVRDAQAYRAAMAKFVKAGDPITDIRDDFRDEFSEERSAPAASAQGLANAASMGLIDLA